MYRIIFSKFFQKLSQNYFEQFPPKCFKNSFLISYIYLKFFFF